MQRRFGMGVVPAEQLAVHTHVLGGGTGECSYGDPSVPRAFRGVPQILNIPMGSENSDGFQNVPLHSDQF